MISSTSEAPNHNSLATGALSWTLLSLFGIPLVISSSLSLAYLSGIDQLVGQALGDGLDVAECGFTGSSAEQPDCLVDASQW